MANNPLTNYQGYSRTNTKVKGNCPPGMRRTGGERKYERVGNRFQWVEYSTCANQPAPSAAPAQSAPSVNVNVSPTFQQSFTPQLSPNFIVGSEVGGNLDATTGQVAPGGQTAMPATPSWMQPAAPAQAAPYVPPAKPYQPPAVKPVPSVDKLPTAQTPTEKQGITLADIERLIDSRLPTTTNPAQVTVPPVSPQPAIQHRLPAPREPEPDNDWLWIAGAGIATLAATALYLSRR